MFGAASVDNLCLRNSKSPNVCTLNMNPFLNVPPCTQSYSHVPQSLLCSTHTILCCLCFADRTIHAVFAAHMQHAAYVWELSVTPYRCWKPMLGLHGKSTSPLGRRCVVVGGIACIKLTCARKHRDRHETHSFLSSLPLTHLSCFVLLFCRSAVSWFSLRDETVH